MLLFPLYLDMLGATHAQIGTIMATASFGGLASRPVAGWALDTIGRKKTLVVATSILAIAMSLVWFVTDLGPTVYAVRLLVGVGAGTCFAGYFAYAADIVPAHRRTAGIAIFGVSGLLPLAINPFSSQLGVTPSDLRWFLPCVGVLILSSLLTLSPVHEPETRSSENPVTRAAVFTALKARSLWSVWLAGMVLATMIHAFMCFATVLAEHREVLHPTYLWLTYALGATAVRLGGGKLPDRIGPSNMVVPSLGMYAVGLLVTAFALTDFDFMLAGLLCGVGHGYGFPVLTSQVIERVPAAYRGSGMAFFTALFGITNVLFTPLLGALADGTSPAIMFVTAAGFGVFALLFWKQLETGRS